MMADRMSHCQQSAGLPTHSGYLYACVDKYNYILYACITNNGCMLVHTYASTMICQLWLYSVRTLLKHTYTTKIHCPSLK